MSQFQHTGITITVASCSQKSHKNSLSDPVSWFWFEGRKFKKSLEKCLTCQNYYRHGHNFMYSSKYSRSIQCGRTCNCIHPLCSKTSRKHTCCKHRSDQKMALGSHLMLANAVVCLSTPRFFNTVPV
jgi:hypothetical protein